ncbi:MAG TPA: MFS transporter, partial [Myxococcota bacterium]|nr:MFS transporter [Myxococcota bacterium]
ANAIGLLTAATLLGSALATLGAGLVAHRVAPRRVLFAACALLAATGLGMAFAPSFGWLLAIAFVGTFNPSAGDVSVFLPTEQALLAGSGAPERRVDRFAIYNVAGAVAGMLGSFLAGGSEAAGLSATRAALIGLFAYAALGAVLWVLYLRMRSGREAPPREAAVARPLARSRGTVLRLSALFTLDSFGGGFAVQTLLAVWLTQRFGASAAEIGLAFGVTQALNAASQLAAPLVARRIGLIRTMVFTHIPANVFLIATGFMPTLPLAIACLWLRASLSQMDVPARQAYVMSVVPEEERSAAASVTNVPRSFGSALSPLFAGALLAGGAFSLALALGGGLKLLYDALLLAGYGKRPAPHERGRS